MKSSTIALSLTLLSSGGVWATTDACGDDAMIVFDGSGSMAEMGYNDISEPRIFDARRAMQEVIPEIANERKLGLVIYGPGGADSCSGVDVRFAPIENASSRILNDINAVEPEGETPLTEAVKRAADVLREDGDDGVVVLVTDGKETCEGAPCQLAAQLSGEGVTLHVIGFKVRGSYFSWETTKANDYTDAEAPSRCLADRTGGVYVRAETLDELKAALRTTLGCNVLM